tara:strand:- start:897 stop:1196 length:300 start_codon:yes stop_codon:yes gene_type:complete
MNSFPDSWSQKEIEAYKLLKTFSPNIVLNGDMAPESESKAVVIFHDSNILSDKWEDTFVAFIDFGFIKSNLDSSEIEANNIYIRGHSKINKIVGLIYDY